MGEHPTLADRLWVKVDKTGDCWLWTGGRDPQGYGSIRLGSRAAGSDRTHRVAWFLTHGQIPTGLCVLHRCDNPPCCNPAHLFLGTRAENSADMVAKGRGRTGGVRGERHGCAKVTSVEVRAIRASSATQREIAAQFEVSQALVGKIRRRELWRHL